MGSPSDDARAVLELTLARPATLGRGRLVCVDGPTGSGKTTLASGLQELSPGAAVVHSDELLEGWELGRVDFLKMNIEGAEAAALAGLGRNAGRVRHVTVSCHDFLADRGGDPANRTSETVRRVLAGYGFTVNGRRPGDRRHWTRFYLYGTKSSTST